MKRALLYLGSVVLASIDEPAFAVNPEKHPCVKDAERACPALKPGHGAVRQCLKDRPDVIGPVCRGKYEEWMREYE